MSASRGSTVLYSGFITHSKIVETLFLVLERFQLFDPMCEINLLELYILKFFFCKLKGGKFFTIFQSDSNFFETRACIMYPP